MAVVLVIDDDQEIAEMLRLLLTASGFETYVALEGQEGLRKAAETSPDVVLLDIMMPDLSGWQVFEQLRRQFSVPIIFVSAYDNRANLERARRMGATDFIRKPFRPEELMACIHMALERRRLDPIH